MNRRLFGSLTILLVAGVFVLCAPAFAADGACDQGVLDYIRAIRDGQFNEPYFCKTVAKLMQTEQIGKIEAMRKAMLHMGLTEENADQAIATSRRFEEIKRQAATRPQAPLKPTKFSFAGVQWGDSAQTVKAKIEKSKMFDKVSLMPSTRHKFQVDKFLWDELTSQYAAGWEACPRALAMTHLLVANPQGSVSLKTSPVEGAEFSFSATTNKLLYYTIMVKARSGQSVWESMLEKYGQKFYQVNHQHPRMAKWVKWQDGQELAYFSTAYRNYIVVAYINHANIAEVLNLCAEARTLVQKEKQKVEGMF